MERRQERAHGVTPGLSRDYAHRTAEHQAAFVLPLLRPGMSLLDVGCGPGTITVGLAASVAPAWVTGLDADDTHLGQARDLAARRGQDRVTFRAGDALALPFADASFEVTFENNLLLHLADSAPLALAEMRRVLRPGGLVAVRDAYAAAVVWYPPDERISEHDALFRRWHASRGSDIDLGGSLPALVRSAGFVDIVTSVSADTKGTADQVHEHAQTMCDLLAGPFGHDAVERGWAEPGQVARMRDALLGWERRPGAFFANVHVEVVGRRPR